MNRLAIIFALLCLLQLLGISGSVIASVIDVESIVVTGPVFAAVGLAVACGWIASRDASILVFGLSAGIVSLFLLMLIALLKWSPSDAQFPVPLILLGYEVVVVPVGLFSMYKTLVIPHHSNVDGTWQFNLRTLLIVTFVISVCCAATRLAFDLGSAALLAMAIGLFTATLIGIGVVGYRVSCHYSSTNEIRPT